MALTLEQESALLALLNEKRTTLPQLSAATEVTNSDLLLINQMLADKSVTADVLKRFIAPDASTEQAGVVQLSNRIDSDSDITAATSRAVKAAKDSLLSRSANLADVGSVAEVLKNLGILSAAKRDVGNGASQLPDMSFFHSNLANNGWQKSPSGLIVQWGSASPNANGRGEVYFPIAFTRRPFTLTFGYRESTYPTVAQSIVIEDGTLNSTGFICRSMITSTPVQNGQSAFFWRAEGV